LNNYQFIILCYNNRQIAGDMFKPILYHLTS